MNIAIWKNWGKVTIMIISKIPYIEWIMRCAWNTLIVIILSINPRVPATRNIQILIFQQRRPCERTLLNLIYLHFNIIILQLALFKTQPFNYKSGQYSKFNMISGVAKSFASVTIIRVLSRILEFFLRVYLIRQVLSAQILAQMVALDLILTTSLHITKSCFKPSYQQVESKQKQQNIISSMNLMSIGILGTLASAIIVIAMQWHHKIQLRYVNQTILLYGVCSVVEALKEKYSVQFVLGYQYKKIALIQLVSYLPKTFMLFIAAKTGMFYTYGILMFGIGNLIYYGMCLLLTFYLTNYKIIFIKSFPPSQIKRQNSIGYLDKKTKKILKQLSYISILKLFLQQFEKIVLVFNNAVQDSSIYSLVSNLGSIIIRFVFAPLEQIAYNYYSRGTEEESKKTLIALVKIINIFGFICIGFGCRYSENVLFILYGEKWVNVDSVFAFQSFMLLVGIIGLNGSIDSFVMARADVVNTVPKLKYLTIITTVIYFGSSILFLHFGLGAGGLFLGNAMGMLSRIVINWNIEIKKHISLAQFMKGVFPSKFFTIVIIFCLLLSYIIKYRVSVDLLIDLGIGMVLFGISCLPLAYQYKGLILGYIRERKAKMQ